MNKLIVILLCISMLLMTGCATVRRHPVLFGLATGVAVGITIAVVERKGHCPPPYTSGDPPCFDNDGTPKR